MSLVSIRRLRLPHQIISTWIEWIKVNNYQTRSACAQSCSDVNVSPYQVCELQSLWVFLVYLFVCCFVWIANCLSVSLSISFITLNYKPNQQLSANLWWWLNRKHQNSRLNHFNFDVMIVMRWKHIILLATATKDSRSSRTQFIRTSWIYSLSLFFRHILLYLNLSHVLSLSLFCHFYSPIHLLILSRSSTDSYSLQMHLHLA